MFRARAFFVVPIALLVLTLTACGGSSGPKSVPDDAVAVVGNTTITKADFAALMLANRASYKLKGQPIPAKGTAAFRVMQNKVLDLMVQAAEFTAAAKSDLDIEIPQSEVDKRLADYKKQYLGGSQQRYEAELAKQGTNEAQVKVRLQAQLLGDAIFKKLSDRATVSDDDIEGYYKSHLTGYQQPAKRQVRHILLKTKAQALTIEQKLKDGGDFSALAKQYSTDTSTSALGGRLPGGIVTGQTLPPFDKAAFSLKTNEVSAPIQTQYGWHVIQPTADVVPAKTTPLAQVSSAIHTQLLQQAKQNAMTAWITGVKTDYAKKTLYAAGYGPAAPAGPGG